MLSKEYCKKVLQKKGRKLKDAEVELIRQLLYAFAEMEFQNSKIKIDGKEGNSLYKGVNR